MASLSHSPVTFTGNLASGTSALDHLRSSINGVTGVPLKALGRARLGATRRDFTVSAKVRKGKKHEYPWPDDADPNVKGGVLSHLSHFKPLKEKQKPVTLEFEKPLMALQKKIIDVQKMANETGLDFTDQIISLENKYQQALKDLYTHLTPIQRVNIARHPNRPTFLDHVSNITERFVELHGDRSGYDDPAIVTGLGTINGRSYMFMGHQKGRNTKENIQRNFGMPTPHGYRKALRMMYYADHHGFPIITFIDTPGAFADLKSEELGQGEAIAHNLRTMFGLKVPIVSFVIGEGGSGGALAIGCANKLLMLENAVFYVASPEACAAILWKSAKASPKAAEKLKITAGELCKLQIADGIVPEPLGGGHADPYWTSQQIKTAIVDAMDELIKMDTQELLKHRMLKFRKLGGFQEGIPADPKKKINMKKKEEPILNRGKTTNLELENEVEKLKQQIQEAKESTTEHPELGLNEMIEKLKREVDHEFSEAVKAMGLKDRLVMLREEFAKSRNSKDQPMNLALKGKIEKLKDEFNQGLSAAPNYASLKHKLDMLEEISKAKNLSEKDNKIGTLKQEINEKFTEVLDQPDMKEKIEALKKEIEDSGVSTFAELNQDLKEKILQVKEETEIKFADVLKSLGMHVEPPSFSDVKVKIEELNDEINHIIEDVINSSDLKNKIEQLKLEVAKAGKTPDLESKRKIMVLEQQIKQSLAEVMDSIKTHHPRDCSFASAGGEEDEQSPIIRSIDSNFTSPETHSQFERSIDLFTVVSSMASMDGLVPITRAFLASYYDKYPFTPLSDDVSRLTTEIRSVASDLCKDFPPTEGESLLIDEADCQPPHKIDENMWKNREQIEEILFLLESSHWPEAFQQQSTSEDAELASLFGRLRDKFQNTLKVLEFFQSRNAEYVFNTVMTYMPQDFRGTLIRQQRERSERNKQAEVDALVSAGGSIRDRYAMLWNQQMERRRQLAQLGSATGVYKTLVKYLVGVPEVLLDFIQKINDDQGPMEEQRHRYGPPLYSLTTMVLTIRLLLSLSFRRFEDRKLQKHQISVLEEAADVYTSEFERFIKFIGEVFTNSPFFITAEVSGALEGRKNDDYKELTIPAGKTYEVSLSVESINSYIAWDFALPQSKMNLDIGFSVEYTDSLGKTTLILPYRRYESDQGNFCTIMAGNYKLIWDNSYSTFFRKVLRYKVDCIPPVVDPVNSAATEAEEG